MTDNAALAQELEGYIKAFDDADYLALSEAYEVAFCVNENAEIILSALRNQQSAPTPNDVRDMAAALRLHAFDDCGHREMPTHIGNVAADMLERLAQSQQPSEDMVERVARAIASVKTWDGDRLDMNTTPDELNAIARAAITAMRGG